MQQHIVEVENPLDKLKGDVDALVSDLQQNITTVTTFIAQKVYELTLKKYGTSQPSSPAAVQQPQQPTQPSSPPVQQPKKAIGMRHKVGSWINDMFWGKAHPHNPNLQRRENVGSLTLSQYLEYQKNATKIAELIIEEIQNQPPTPTATPMPQQQPQQPQPSPQNIQQSIDPEHQLNGVFQAFKTQLIDLVMSYVTQYSPQAAVEQPDDAPTMQRSKQWWDRQIGLGNTNLKEKSKVSRWFDKTTKRIKPAKRPDAKQFMIDMSGEPDLDWSNPRDVRLIWPDHAKIPLIGPD